ncbi:MAG TPA: 4Fe-4S dicluster domain-containing protein [Candidatus Methanoperedens sp.]|nr:4Fe-4S dicluster domain-containing protein [Candidatus Methanoperedens sp.]
MGMGMFVDTTICTGCKACQVACKQWNGLEPEPAHFQQEPGRPYPVATNFSGNSYDNTGRLSARDWRHVLFNEQVNYRRVQSRWLFMSDSCKHCNDAACLNVCPVEAIERTDLGNVIVRQDKCVGTKLCNKACPYGVITYSEKTRTSHKCSLCNDRIHNGLGTACAKACPTGSIQFGEIRGLKTLADARLERLRSLAETKANLYGYHEAGGLNVFYLLNENPAVYGLPENPVVPQRKKYGLLPRRLEGLPLRLTALATGVAALVRFRERGSRDPDVAAGG